MEESPLPKDIRSELTAIMEEREETLRADGKSEKKFVKTPYPETFNLPSDAEWYDPQDDWFLPHVDKWNEENVKRFDRKRWSLWWRKIVLERYTDVSLAPVKTEKGEFTRDKFVELQWILHEHLRDKMFQKGESIHMCFWEPRLAKFPIERMMERRRNYELLFWESISFNAYYPKFANLDEDKKAIYNRDDYFAYRKKLTRSKLPLNLRSFGLFIQRLHTTPYAEEYRLVRRIAHPDFPNGKWTAEPLKNEIGEARMHPIQGHRQNFMVELSKKIWERFNEETPARVVLSNKSGPLFYVRKWFKTEKKGASTKWIRPKLSEQISKFADPKYREQKIEDQPTWGPPEAVEVTDQEFANYLFIRQSEQWQGEETFDLETCHDKIPGQ
jgi:hypothetical protein